MAPQRPRTIAYLRVSTSEQDVTKNQADILMLAHRKHLGHVQFVEETISSRVPWRRRKIAQVLDTLHAGDTLVVSELSRLGRSMLECMEIIAIATQKGLHLHAVKGDWQLDGSMQSTIIAMAFAMAAEIERDLISQRTREALRAKKAAGVQLGRPRGPGKSKLDPYQPEIEALLGNGSTQKFIAKRYGTTAGTLHNWLKKRGIKRTKGSHNRLWRFASLCFIRPISHCWCWHGACSFWQQYTPRARKPLHWGQPPDVTGGRRCGRHQTAAHRG